MSASIPRGIEANRNGIHALPKCETRGCGQVLFSDDYAVKHRAAHGTRPSAKYPKSSQSRSPVIQAKQERIGRAGPESIDGERRPRKKYTWKLPPEEVSALRSAVANRPEVREKLRAAMNRPEVREKLRAAMNRPEVREKLRAAMNRPEVREKRRAAMNRPEVREKRRATWRSKRIARLRAQLDDLEHPPEVRVVETSPGEPNAFRRLEE